MTTTLSNIEKKAIVDQAIKQVDYSIYSSQLELIQLNAVTGSDPELIATYENNLVKLNSKRSALEVELESLAEQV